MGEIARGMRLSDQQHAALHEVAAATYRAAGDLLAPCPVENPLTPVGGLDVERAETRALLFGINAVRPVLADFEDTLKADQKKSLDAMMNPSPNFRASAP
jgi:LTXXQ motif family protein